MTATITAQTPARLVFDKDGDVDQQTMDDLVGAIRTAAVTDLFIFSHGWNNDGPRPRIFVRAHIDSPSSGVQSCL
jgi:hypothetical protein